MSVDSWQIGSRQLVDISRQLVDSWQIVSRQLVDRAVDSQQIGSRQLACHGCAPLICSGPSEQETRERNADQDQPSKETIAYYDVTMLQHDTDQIDTVADNNQTLESLDMKSARTVTSDSEVGPVLQNIIDFNARTWRNIISTCFRDEDITSQAVSCQRPSEGGRVGAVTAGWCHVLQRPSWAGER